MTNGEQEKPDQPSTQADANVSGSVEKKQEKKENSSETATTSTASEGTSKTASKKSAKAGKASRGKGANAGEKRPFPILALLASVALLLGLVLAAAGFWQYQQSQQLANNIDQLASRQTNFDQQLQALGPIQSDVSVLKQQQQSLLTRIEQGEDSRRSMRVSLDQLSSQVKSLTIAKGKQPLYWRVSEVEYLLTVANRRLTLERDVNTAKEALQDADNRLRAIGDPGLIPVRDKISQELNRLNSVTLPDIPGMAAQLGALVDDTQQLPLLSRNMTMEPNDQQTAADAESKEYSGFRQFVKTVWGDLVDGLFRVQRTDEPVKPLLPPQDRQYLMQNLRLQLEQARLALLQSDTAMFRNNLSDVEHWVQQYFDTEATPVTHVLDTVQELKTEDLTPELPDISASLRELRAWMATQDHAPQASAAQSPRVATATARAEVTTP